MNIVVVPNMLRDKINERLNEAIASLPEKERGIAEPERDNYYQFILDYFDKYGIIPSFSLEKKKVLQSECRP